MADPLITLTTDFGTGSPYVAAMKGVLLALNPAARLLDLGHEIPPQDVRHAAFFLASALPYFPTSALHVVVVDPGVGSERAILYVAVGGQRLLVPDNGCWTLLEQGSPTPPRVRRLAEPRFWRPTVSATFHGRDIFAPAAAHLSLGAPPEELGPPAADWVRLDSRPPTRTPDGVTGEVIFVDRFGNLITNIPGEALGPPNGRDVQVTVGDAEVPRRVRAYAEAEPGALVALLSSVGLVEVAVAQGSAAWRLHAGAGTAVEVRWRR
jgi:S-adenosyl-L-methionine hydrolase (adenosine-forming)